MALGLGCLGRLVLTSIVDRPALRKVGFIGRGIKKITFGKFTPGLSRETFALSRQLKRGDEVKIEADGFYRGGVKIAGNSAISDALSIKSFRCVDANYEDQVRYLRANLRYKSIKPSDFFTPYYARGWTALFYCRLPEGVARSLTEEMQYTLGRFGSQDVSLPDLSAISLWTSFKREAVDRRALLKMAILIPFCTALIWAATRVFDKELNMETLFYALGFSSFYYSVYLIAKAAKSLSDGDRVAEYIGGGFLRRARIGLNLFAGDLRCSIGHEMVHHLKALGYLTDDRIGEAVTIMRRFEMAGSSRQSDVINETELQLIGAEKRKELFQKIRFLGEDFVLGTQNEEKSGAYEFGCYAGEIAVWISKNMDSTNFGWEYLNLVARGMDPETAFNQVMANKVVI